MNFEINLHWFVFHIRILWKHTAGGNFFERVLLSFCVRLFNFGFRIALADWEVITAEYNPTGLNKPIKPKMVGIKLITLSFSLPGCYGIFGIEKGLGVRSGAGTEINYRCDFTTKRDYSILSWRSKAWDILDIRRYNFHQKRRLSLRPFFPVSEESDYRSK